jgi:hypothetical protein
MFQNLLTVGGILDTGGTGSKDIRLIYPPVCKVGGVGGSIIGVIRCFTVFEVRRGLGLET